MEPTSIFEIQEVEIIYHSKPSLNQIPQVLSSSDSFNIFKSNWSRQIGMLEEFNMLLLDNANTVLGMSKLSKGGISAVLVDCMRPRNTLLIFL